MKFTLPFLKKGQRVSAEVVEALDTSMYIVNFNGDLIRMKNSTGRHFSPGDRISLEVTGVNPLSFKISDAHSPHLNRTV